MEDVLLKIIGFFHIIFSILIAFYGILFKKSRFDYMYIFYTLFVLISWTIYNGECPLTYYVKKYYDKNYVSGKDPTDLKDTYLLFGDKQIVYIIVTGSIFAYMISEYIVLTRNNFSKYICYLLPITHFLYTMSVRTFKNLPENNRFLILQESFKIIFIILLILFTREYLSK